MPANKDGYGRPIPRRHRAKALMDLRCQEEYPELSSKNEKLNTEPCCTCRTAWNEKLVVGNLVNIVGELADDFEGATQFCLKELELNQSKDCHKNQENDIEESADDFERVKTFFLKEMEPKQSENSNKNKAVRELSDKLEKELWNILKHQEPKVAQAKFDDIKRLLKPHLENLNEMEVKIEEFGENMKKDLDFLKRQEYKDVHEIQAKFDDLKRSLKEKMDEMRAKSVELADNLKNDLYSLILQESKDVHKTLVSKNNINDVANASSEDISSSNRAVWSRIKMWYNRLVNKTE